MTRRLVALSAIAIVWWLGMALPASAHPLGNFSVNVYNGIVVASDEVRIDHVIDVAEIPTVQSMPTLDADGDKKVTATELATFARSRCGESLGGLEFTVGGAATTLRVDSSSAELVAGQAGLSTTRIECSISGPLTITDDSDVSFQDDSAAGDVGWREVTLQGDSVTITDADVPTTSPSAQLTSYPASQVDSPLRVDSASAVVTPGGAALAASEVSNAPTSGTSPWQWGANLLGTVSSTASGPFGMTVAVLFALMVGALHALAPGHGKSLVAFALAGRQERAGRAAMTVGATVTATHTASVLILGLLVAGATTVIPGSLFSLMSVVTGAMILVLGLALLRNALRNGGHGLGHTHGPSDSHASGHSPSHGHSHPHTHPHPHSHVGEQVSGATALAVREDTHTHEPDVTQLPKARRGVLVTLGITGGLTAKSFGGHRLARGCRGRAGLVRRTAGPFVRGRDGPNPRRCRVCRSAWAGTAVWHWLSGHPNRG